MNRILPAMLFLISFPTLIFADTKPTFDIRKTAVLIMDYQNAIINGGYMKTSEGVLVKADKVLSEARKIGLPVIYIVVGFRPGFPEISPNNLMFSSIKKSGGLGQDPKLLAIHSSVSPKPEDIIITKHRVGAFLGTDLDMILRAKEINTIVMFGVATSGVVLSTLRHASDADYKSIILKDLCADKDPETHQVLMEKVFPRQAEIISSDDFLAALAKSAK
ncbi:isochorismatase family protein [Leptospira fainei serovar Hurstbridge str. BUT 6]|uniref:Isochorismatase family protein n=1 Tax=Leptospira fainei serovar Hurstbridge str. BUT 6 TaxID=1193011 RepID=S3UVV9_9LEPT|nr:isochorismatase family cysteine hydrolase [Leptospira fainei]EPG72479.1 isochorismatase family protein [Leptospira fainei serovar Hurstbridge str. BUT 6]